MADFSNNKLAIECFIALLVGLAAVAVVAHAGPSSLDGDSYAQALRVMAGTPAGGSEMVARTLFSAIGPVFGWKPDASGLIKFYLTAPLLLDQIVQGKGNILRQFLQEFDFFGVKSF